MILTNRLTPTFSNPLIPLPKRLRKVMPPAAKMSCALPTYKAHVTL